MGTWRLDQIMAELKDRGWYKSHREIEYGIHFTMQDDTPIDWYEKSGKAVVRGKDTPLKREAATLFGEKPQVVPAPGARAVPQPTTKRVFVVYGHDQTARRDLELLLHRLKLEPVILGNLPPAGDTIIEKLEQLTNADFACVLLTPDDQGCKMGCPTEMKPRARQNVVLELGMMLTKLGRKRVAILVKGTEIEKPSDIAGLLYLPFSNQVDEIKTMLGGCLKDAGFDIDVRDLI